jgi:hypothetical protein
MILNKNYCIVYSLHFLQAVYYLSVIFASIENLFAEQLQQLLRIYPEGLGLLPFHSVARAAQAWNTKIR